MSNAVFYVGDALTVLKTLEPDSVDLVITSPPFLALRSYLPADHPDKNLEMGSELDPGAYVDALMLVVEELRRVLAPHGSLCIELGDTYAGSGGAGGDYNENGLREGQPKFKQVKTSPDTGGSEFARDNKGGGVRIVSGGHGWPLPKSLSLIPELTRLTMAYGRNPINGRETEPWRIRNVIRWVRPNPPVGALGDKFRPATTDMLVACTSSKRYFDLDAVREPPTHPTGKVSNNNVKGADERSFRFQERIDSHPAGAPPLDWWNIPTHPYKGAHYATFPPELIVKPVKAMSPERVCRECGEPSRRLTSVDYEPQSTSGNSHQPFSPGAGFLHHDATKQIETLGWSDCGHNQWRPGVVLDPFAGTGTVLAVATGHSRDAIGIDIDSRNAALALGRVGPLFMEIIKPVGV